MVTRNIFNQFQGPTEQRLLEDLINEKVQVVGSDWIYIPRISNSPDGFDLLFGDDPVKAFANNYTIECQVLSVDGFIGSEVYSKFGLQVKKQAELLMPNRAWKREVQGAILRPQEGDLMYSPIFKALFEIKFVDGEYFYYDLGKDASDPYAPETGFYAFKLTISKFKYNDETIQTTVPEINDVVNSVIATYVFTMNPGGTGTYVAGDIVFQTSNNNIHGAQTANAIVSSWTYATQTLELNTISGLFLPNVSIFDANTSANWTLNTYDMLTNINNPLMDNPGINEEAQTVLNFSQDNPFGEP